jgi:adhesin/invasin
VVGHAASAGFGARVGFVASDGTITPTVVTVNALGRAAPRFVAGAITGTVWITASLGGVSVSAPLTITSGQPASIEMIAAPDRIASGGGQAVITAVVRDEGGSAALHGVPVAFTTTLGSVNPMTATTSAGRAATVLTSGPISGTAHVQAAAGGVSMTIPVQIVGAGQPYSIAVTAQPATLIVAAAPATITATVFDGLGQRVADGTSVQFAADRGIVTPAQATTVGGQASTQFAAGTAPGQARVTATADGVRGEVYLFIQPGPALTVTLAASPQELIAGYGQTAMLRAAASDRFGNLVADGTRLDFTASLGQASPSWVTTTSGAAEAHFVGGLIAGTSTITVTAAGGAWAQAQVRIRPAAAASLTLHITPTAISVGGEAAMLRATVRDQYGNAVADGVAVEFMTDLGSLRHGAGAVAADETHQVPGTSAVPGTWWAISRTANAGVDLAAGQAITLTVTTTGGVATAELVSGETPGVAHVRAARGLNLVQTGVVVIQPGAPAALSLAIEPSQVPVGGRAVITATVRDQFSNPVADGITVRFRVSRGQLTASQASTRDGQATTTLIAPRQLGPISVFVETAAGSAAAFGEVETIPARAYLPMATR